MTPIECLFLLTFTNEAELSKTQRVSRAFSLLCKTSLLSRAGPNAHRYSSVLSISTAKNESFPHFLGFSEIFFPSNFRGVTRIAVHKFSE